MTLSNKKFTISQQRGQVGSADLERKGTCIKNRTMSGCVQTMSIYLPAEQKVFRGERAGLVGGPLHAREAVYTGTYKTNDGRINREITLRVQSMGEFQIGGVMDGELFVDMLSGY